MERKWVVGRSLRTVEWELGLSDCQATADCSWATAKSMPQIPKLFYPKWHHPIYIHPTTHTGPKKPLEWKWANADPCIRTSTAAATDGGAATSTHTQPAMLLALNQNRMQGASQADAFQGCHPVAVDWAGSEWMGPWVGMTARLTPGQLEHTATYIMQPQQFPPLRIRLYVTLEVNIVAFLDIIRCQSWAQA